ncbi:MAG: hypothetical protein AAFX55_06655 [Bacteroidota bacterium]
MRAFFLIFYLCCALQVIAQQDSLKILLNNSWTPKEPNSFAQNWLEVDTITLKSTATQKRSMDSLFQKNDLTEKEIRSLIYLIKQQKEKISFDSVNEVRHTQYILCPVGVTLFHLEKFDLKNKFATLTYTKSSWNSNQESNSFITNYNIHVWNENKIVLSKIKE